MKRDYKHALQSACLKIVSHISFDAQRRIGLDFISFSIFVLIEPDIHRKSHHQVNHATGQLSDFKLSRAVKDLRGRLSSQATSSSNPSIANMFQHPICPCLPTFLGAKPTLASRSLLRSSTMYMYMENGLQIWKPCTAQSSPVAGAQFSDDDAFVASHYVMISQLALKEEERYSQTDSDASLISRRPDYHLGGVSTQTVSISSGAS